MDIGRFVRRRTELWTWILGPILLIWFAHAGVLLYHLMAESTLAGLKAHRDVVPEMLSAQAAVRARLGGFQQLLSQESEAMAEITAVLDHAEVKSGFVMNSVRREEADRPKQKGVTAVQVSVIGAGELTEVIRFLDEIQQPRYLVDVVSANLNIMAADSNPIYSARFVFKCYNIGASEVKASGQAEKGAGSTG